LTIDIFPRPPIVDKPPNGARHKPPTPPIGAWPKPSKKGKRLLTGARPFPDVMPARGIRESKPVLIEVDGKYILKEKRYIP
jgi:hypothetical protein